MRHVVPFDEGRNVVGLIVRRFAIDRDFELVEIREMLENRFGRQTEVQQAGDLIDAQFVQTFDDRLATGAATEKAAGRIISLEGEFQEVAEFVPGNVCEERVGCDAFFGLLLEGGVIPNRLPNQRDFVFQVGPHRPALQPTSTAASSAPDPGVGNKTVTRPAFARVARLSPNLAIKGDVLGQRLHRLAGRAGQHRCADFGCAAECLGIVFRLDGNRVRFSGRPRGIFCVELGQDCKSVLLGKFRDSGAETFRSAVAIGSSDDQG